MVACGSTVCIANCAISIVQQSADFCGSSVCARNIYSYVVCIQRSRATIKYAV